MPFTNEKRRSRERKKKRGKEEREKRREYVPGLVVSEVVDGKLRFIAFRLFRRESAGYRGSSDKEGGGVPLHLLAE